MKKIFSKKHYFSQKMRFGLGKKIKFFVKYEAEHYLGTERFAKEAKSIMVAKIADGLQKID